MLPVAKTCIQLFGRFQDYWILLDSMGHGSQVIQLPFRIWQQHGEGRNTTNLHGTMILKSLKVDPWKTLEPVSQSTKASSGSKKLPKILYIYMVFAGIRCASARHIHIKTASNTKDRSSEWIFITWTRTARRFVTWPPFELTLFCTSQAIGRASSLTLELLWNTQHMRGQKSPLSIGIWIRGCGCVSQFIE